MTKREPATLVEWVKSSKGQRATKAWATALIADIEARTPKERERRHRRNAKP